MCSTEIKTFVIMDLETTGLPYMENNKTKITELAFLAATREHICNAVLEQSSLPRVTQKLGICVNPRKMIQPGSTDITGLSNELLENEKPFDENLCVLLNNFLERLTPPICILAHNGMRFDFPILQAELNKCNKGFPEHVLCADSLTAFKHILTSDWRTSEANISSEYQNVSISTSDNSLSALNISNSIQCESYSSKRLDINDKNHSLAHVESKINSIISPYPNTINQLEEYMDDTFNESLRNMQKLNETTPMRNKTVPRIAPHLSGVKPKSDNVAGVKCARKRLFPNKKELQDGINMPKSFKLVDIHNFLLKKPAVGSHHAESDVLHLLECIVATSIHFVHWADSNAIKFNLIKKMW